MRITVGTTANGSRGNGRRVAQSDGGELGIEALAAPPAPVSAPADTTPFRDRVQAFERALIGEALTAAGGNRAEAARRLGLSRVTMLDRMKRLGLS